MKKVYIINGSGGVGKDTFVEIAKYFFFIKSSIMTYNISSVDQVKTAASLLGWDCEKDDKGRKFLSDLKFLSSDTYNGPYNYMLNKVNSKTEGIFFLHIREPSEIAYYKKHNLDTKTIAIYRDNIQQFNNRADKEAYNYNYDIEINNNGSIEELVQKVEKFVEGELNV